MTHQPYGGGYLNFFITWVEKHDSSPTSTQRGIEEKYSSEFNTKVWVEVGTFGFLSVAYVCQSAERSDIRWVCFGYIWIFGVKGYTVLRGFL